MKNVSFWFGSGAHVCCYYYFSHLLKVTFLANKQTQKKGNSSLYIYTLIHQSQGEKSWTFLGSMERKVTNKLNSCKFYQMHEAIFLK